MKIIFGPTALLAFPTLLLFVMAEPALADAEDHCTAVAASIKEAGFSGRVSVRCQKD